MKITGLHSLGYLIGADADGYSSRQDESGHSIGSEPT